MSCLSLEKKNVCVCVWIRGKEREGERVCATDVTAALY